MKSLLFLLFLPAVLFAQPLQPIGSVVTTPDMVGVVIHSESTTVATEHSNRWTKHGAILLDSIALTNTATKKVSAYRTTVALRNPNNNHRLTGSGAASTITVITKEKLTANTPVVLRIAGYNGNQPLISLIPYESQP